MYVPVPPQPYAENAQTPIEQDPVCSLAELREELEFIPKEEGGLELAIIAGNSPVELSTVLIQTESDYGKLIADKNGENIEKADDRYDTALNLNVLDSGGWLHGLREKCVEAREDQERANARIAAMQPDKDLADRIEEAQKVLSAGRRRLTMAISTLAVAGVGVLCGVKTDNVQAERLAGLAGVGAATGLAIGRGIENDFYPDWAHTAAKERVAEARANTVVLKPYVR